MNRRTFLKRGLAGGALLAAGGVGLSLWPTMKRWTPTRQLRVLDLDTFNIMAAIVGRVVTAPGADPVAITQTIDAALARAVPEAQADLVQALKLLENGVAGLMLDLRAPKPFTHLSPEAQDRALLAWRDSRLVLRRGAYKALRNLASTSYYRKESAWADASYPGPPDWILTMQAAPVPAATDEGATP